LSGTIIARSMPNPPPRPVTKNAGGPPIGPLIAPKTKNEALPWSSLYPPKTDSP